MTSISSAHTITSTPSTRGLRNLYAVRAAFSALWVTTMFLVGVPMPWIGALLVVIYPAWDAVATVAELRVQSDTRAKLTHYLNIASSILATIAFGASLNSPLSTMITLFGVWALVTGLFQLFVGLARRRELGGQWAIIVSGAQSSIAGVAFILMAQTPGTGLSSLAGYSAVGAVYFLISAIRLTLRPGIAHQRDTVGTAH